MITKNFYRCKGLCTYDKYAQIFGTTHWFSLRYLVSLLYFIVIPECDTSDFKVKDSNVLY